MILKKRSITQTLVFVAVATAFIVIGAWIRIPIPYVPFTLQFLFTALAAVILGAKWGSLSVLIYLFLGLVGVPVFTKGGGFSYVFQPTFGYLIGFLIGTFVQGMLLDKSKTMGFLRILWTSILNMLIVYTCGMLYFYLLTTFVMQTQVEIWPMFVTSFLMCIPGDIVSCLALALVTQRLAKIWK